MNCSTKMIIILSIIITIIISPAFYEIDGLSSVENLNNTIQDEEYSLTLLKENGQEWINPAFDEAIVPYSTVKNSNNQYEKWIYKDTHIAISGVDSTFLMIKGGTGNSTITIESEYASETEGRNNVLDYISATLTMVESKDTSLSDEGTISYGNITGLSIENVKSDTLYELTILIGSYNDKTITDTGITTLNITITASSENNESIVISNSNNIQLSAILSSFNGVDVSNSNKNHKIEEVIPKDDNILDTIDWQGKAAIITDGGTNNSFVTGNNNIASVTLESSGSPPFYLMFYMSMQNKGSFTVSIQSGDKSTPNGGVSISQTMYAGIKDNKIAFSDSISDLKPFSSTTTASISGKNNTGSANHAIRLYILFPTSSSGSSNTSAPTESIGFITESIDSIVTEATDPDSDYFETVDILFSDAQTRTALRKIEPILKKVNG